VERVNALDDDATLCMSFFTYAELLKGAERSAHRVRVLRQLDTLVAQIPVLYDTGRSLCEQYAKQSSSLRARGTPIGRMISGLRVTPSRSRRLWSVTMCVNSSASKGFHSKIGPADNEP